MLKVIGKVLLIINCIIFICLGITTFFFLTLSYVKDLKPHDSAIGYLLSFSMIGFSILGAFLLRNDKITEYLIPILVLILGFGVYMLINTYCISIHDHVLYNKIVGYISVICSTGGLIACYLNKK